MSSSLGSEFDELNQAWKKAEDKLLSTGCPVNVWVDVGDGSSLGLYRLKSVWRLCIKDNEVVRPVTESPFAVRIKASGYLSDLEVAIKAVTEALKENLRWAINNLHEFCGEEDNVMPDEVKKSVGD